MPTVADYAAEILREVGLGSPDTLTPLLTTPTFTLWHIYDTRAGGSLDLQALYVKKAALDIRLAQEQPDTDFTTESGLQDKQSARFDHLRQMRATCDADIALLESQLRGNRVPVTGAMTKTAPESPPFPDSFDANSPALRGDPYYRSRRPW